MKKKTKAMDSHNNADVLRISQAELERRVAISSASIMKEMYELTTRQIQAEVGRQQALDIKANSLLAYIGISITVSLSIMTVAIPRLTGQPLSVIIYYIATAIILGFALVCGFLASFQAYKAIRISDEFLTLDEDAIFNADGIAAADEQPSDESQVTAYRQYLLPPLGIIMQNDCRANEKKADLIIHGQFYYIVMIGALFAVGLFLLGGKLLL